MSCIQITTFGVLHGAAPEGDALSVDLRKALRNPHDDPAMRYLTGFDARVREHVLATPGAEQVITDTIARMLALIAVTPDDGILHVHVFCQGGKHRSVVIAEEIWARLLAAGYSVGVVHRDINKPVVQKVPASDSGSPLMAAFEADAGSAHTRLARSLRTLAGYIDQNPVLDAATVTIWGGSGSVSLALSDSALPMADRAEAVALIAEALGQASETFTYDDGQVIMAASRRVAGDRRVSVQAEVAKGQWPENTAVAS